MAYLHNGKGKLKFSNGAEAEVNGIAFAWDTGMSEAINEVTTDFAKLEQETAKAAIETAKLSEILDKKFKVGDNVKLISLTDPWIKTAAMKLGTVSKVTQISPDEKGIITDASQGFYIKQNCFELVKCCEMCNGELHCPLHCPQFATKKVDILEWPSLPIPDYNDDPYWSNKPYSTIPKFNYAEKFKKIMPKKKVTCNKCGDCQPFKHYSCCPVFKDAEKNKAKAITLTPPKVESAKAQSVVDLATTYPTCYKTVGLDRLRVFPDTSLTEVKKFIEKCGGKVFARPCPLTPTHGFVDSRVIKSLPEFKALVKEVEERKEKDEILEILLMPVIKAKYSAIFTPHSVTIGKGNDGATGGGKVVMINTPDNLPAQMLSKKLLDKFTKKDEVPFVEVVDTTIVQVRSGASVNCADFIPRDTKVTKVHKVTPDVDLVEWKKFVEKFKDGDVIYAESITCHGAVHGVANSIPVITTRVPKVGEVLKAGDTKPANANKIANQLGFLLEKKLKFEYDEVLHGWKFLHLLGANMTAGREEILAYTLFYSMFGGIAACLGEYRHASGKKLKGFQDGKDREEIFVEAFEDKKRSIELIYKVWPYFLAPAKFPSSGYGGSAWATCAEYTIELSRAIARFIEKPSEKGLKRCIEAANELIHAQHNGGLLFNKFGSCQQEITDIMARTNVITRLLEIKEGKPKGKSWRTLLVHMDKPTPVSVAKYKKQRENMAEYQKKITAKQQKQAQKEAAELLKLKKALAGLTAEQKLQHETTKFQIRVLKEKTTDMDAYYRFQAKVAGVKTEHDVTLKDVPKLVCTQLSMAGTGVKYAGVKLVEVVDKNGSTFTIKVKNKSGKEFNITSEITIP